MAHGSRPCRWDGGRDLNVHRKPQTVAFPALSTERAELEHFADAIKAKKRLAVAGGDEAHGVEVLEAVLE